MTGDILCSDYLPSSLQTAPHVLADRGHAPLATAIDLISANPAAVLGLAPMTIEVGRPLTASLRRFQPDQREATGNVGVALWRSGRLVFGRGSRQFEIALNAV